VGAIIVSPTRELAKQIFDVAVPFLATLLQVGRCRVTPG
jgi:superfamily II DNA/RNA helicase